MRQTLRDLRDFVKIIRGGWVSLTSGVFSIALTAAGTVAFFSSLSAWEVWSFWIGAMIAFF
jgi:hypothetical protein